MLSTRKSGEFFLDSKIDYELSLKKTKGKKQNKIIAALDQAGKSASTQIAEQVDAHLKGAKKRSGKTDQKQSSKRHRPNTQRQQQSHEQRTSTHRRGNRGRFSRGRGRGHPAHGPPSFQQGQTSTDPYSIYKAPMFIFENQVIPIKIHNMSKTFVPNLITTRVLSMGMKFAPTKVSPVWADIFESFKDFHRKLKNKLFFHLKNGPQKQTSVFLTF